MPMTTRPMAAGMIQRMEDAAAVVASCGKFMAGQPVKAAPLVAIGPGLCAPTGIAVTPLEELLLQDDLSPMPLVAIEVARVHLAFRQQRISEAFGSAAAW